jgi:ribosomal-protein-alanine N-acetyltransferase
MAQNSELQKLIKGDRIFLRFPTILDSEEFIKKSKKSSKFHRNLVKPPRNHQEFKNYIKVSSADSNQSFLICNNIDNQIFGAINLSQIYYGGFKNAYLGYYLFSDYTGSGYMTDGLKLCLTYVFRKLKLHRLEANIQPGNSASIKLVKKIGFTKEGYSRKYLKIGGKWCDHERWAIIKEDWELLAK